MSTRLISLFRLLPRRYFSEKVIDGLFDELFEPLKKSTIDKNARKTSFLNFQNTYQTLASAFRSLGPAKPPHLQKKLDSIAALIEQLDSPTGELLVKIHEAETSRPTILQKQSQPVCSQTGIIGVIEMVLAFYDKCVHKIGFTDESGDLRLTLFLKTLRLVNFMYAPDSWTAQNLLSVNSLKALTDMKSLESPDLTVAYAFDKVIPKIDHTWPYPLSEKIHFYVLKMASYCNGSDFCYDYYTNVVINSHLNRDPELAILVVKAKLLEPLISRLIFDNFIDLGGIPTGNLVILLLRSQRIINDLKYMDNIIDRFVKLPLLEQKLGHFGIYTFEEIAEIFDIYISVLKRCSLKNPKLREKLVYLINWMCKFNPDIYKKFKETLTSSE